MAAIGRARLFLALARVVGSVQFEKITTDYVSVLRDALVVVREHCPAENGCVHPGHPDVRAEKCRLVVPVGRRNARRIQSVVRVASPDAERLLKTHQMARLIRLPRRRLGSSRHFHHQNSHEDRKLCRALSSGGDRRRRRGLSSRTRREHRAVAFFIVRPSVLVQFSQSRATTRRLRARCRGDRLAVVLCRVVLRLRSPQAHPEIRLRRAASGSRLGLRRSVLSHPARPPKGIPVRGRLDRRGHRRHSDGHVAPGSHRRRRRAVPHLDRVKARGRISHRRIENGQKHQIHHRADAGPERGARRGRRRRQSSGSARISLFWLSF
mmetsp:Transcript_12002/g.38203  ORF Transcript_12002/g.38203 Transcript_12002/m.38203 type:complete len:323 (+) Transcript_12002:946-1914(+)